MIKVATARPWDFSTWWVKLEIKPVRVDNSPWIPDAVFVDRFSPCAKSENLICVDLLGPRNGRAGRAVLGKEQALELAAALTTMAQQLS